ncbi:MAG: 2-isopropylmalate synthase [Clostridiales bacterium]|nr:2-isopropylmalate synthase [Clostridiales bacterium]
MNHAKYRPFPIFTFKDRSWPENRLTTAPEWCSVDLRDGNQALINPMSLEQKLAFFKRLTEIGFKQIEVGFPAASDTEYNFVRTLIENDLIPDDVTIQALTQSREHIITKTFEALEGVKKAIVHLYNSTSALQRDVVFGMSRDAITGIAVKGAVALKALAEKYGREKFTFQYSPESFTGTEMDYAADVCNAVLDVWKPSGEGKVIINLPSTVEMATPNVYADQIEYMSVNLNYRENVVISVHTHNDRGTGVAATELALLAGAQRVEGTLFGNGERTGNADIMNVALNLYSHGINPKLDFSRIDDIVKTYESFTGLSVHPRHPYAGELVFTAFSGSHQDAINKGMAKRQERGADVWEIPYLPIDPQDVGRGYEPVIRINSQSGKGGAAFVLERGYGLAVPKAMQRDFGEIVTRRSDETGGELLPKDVYDLFVEQYVNVSDPIKFERYKEVSNGRIYVVSEITSNGERREISGSGNGLLSAFSAGLSDEFGVRFDITDYSEHALEHGAKSRAITYVRISDENGKHFFGAGVSESVSKSSLRAVVSALNRKLKTVD